MITPCRICGTTEFKPLWKGIDRFYFHRGEFDLYECRGCGLIFVYPFMTDEALGEYYPKDYYSYENAETAPEKTPRSSSWGRRLRHPLRSLNALIYSRLLGQNADITLPAGSTVLDVGCGDGSYLLKKKGEGCRCFGVDISEDALKRLKARDPQAVTFCGPLWKAGFAVGSFDMVRLSHTLEHIPDIELLAEEALRLLKPAGFLSVQVPNSASLSFAIFRKYWVHLDTPRHVYVFSMKNLRKFFESRGFEVVRTRTLENSFSILASLLYVFNAAFKKKIRVDRAKTWWDSEILKLLLAPYSILVNALNLGDTMEFILKKKNES